MSGSKPWSWPPQTPPPAWRRARRSSRPRPDASSAIAAAPRLTRACSSRRFWRTKGPAGTSAIPCCCRGRSRLISSIGFAARASSRSKARRRGGRACVVNYVHPRFLNAEDETTLDGMEICVDLALLDEASDVVVLRGGEVDTPKYRGRRIFGAGINLTHLYHGRIPFIWYLQRDLGYVNKIYRGLCLEGEPPPDECGGAPIEKLWIAAVESFAIGGHCQVLLVCDYVIAERDAYLTLPARKEGIIPGAANLRLPRFTGDRIARQAILYDRRIDCASPDGRLICDSIADTGTMDAAVEDVVSRLTGSGVVSAAGNRRAIRIGQEPLDLFRNYMAVYAREQAYCHFSPALIANLERYWNAHNRTPA